MNLWPPGTATGVECGRGEAVDADKGLFDKRLTAQVRYADPAAWIVATAIARCLAAGADAAAARERVGVIVASAHGPMETMATVAQAAREGYGSPLRYPAANPAALVGVPCTLMGLRGPTLNLLLPPDRGVPVALFMAGRWLAKPAAAFVAVAVCSRRANAMVSARAVLLGSGTLSVGGMRTGEWLRGAVDGGER